MEYEEMQLKNNFICCFSMHAFAHKLMAQKASNNPDALTSRAAGWFRAPPCPGRLRGKKKMAKPQSCKQNSWRLCSDGGSGWACRAI
jgi:hypothetical protein